MLVSIIVPIYNSFEYLDDCINSIINQTFSNLEILLIDDASTDNSDLVCKKYADKDNRIKIIKLPENKGIANARNIGIDNSTGDYIMFVDSDDTIDNESVSILYSLLISNNADISCGSYDRVFSDFHTSYIGDVENNIKNLNNEDSIYEVLFGNNLASVNNKLFKSSLFNNLRMLSIYYEDLEFIPRLFSKANTIVFSNKILYHWYYRNNSNTTSLLSPGWSIRLLAYNKTIDFIKQNYPKMENKAYELLVTVSLDFLYRSRSIPDNKEERQKISNTIISISNSHHLSLSTKDRIKIISLKIGLWFFDFCFNIKEIFKKRLSC